MRQVQCLMQQMLRTSAADTVSVWQVRCDMYGIYEVCAADAVPMCGRRNVCIADAMLSVRHMQ